MLIRRHSSIVARFVLAALLFSHAALALSSCERGWRAPADAIAGAGEMPCCPESDAESGARNANVCVAHCTADAQNVDSGGHAFPALHVLGVFSESVAPAPGPFALGRPIATPRAPSAPPLHILFKNLRI